jgi:hypothetical protein
MPKTVKNPETNPPARRLALGLLQFQAEAHWADKVCKMALNDWEKTPAVLVLQNAVQNLPCRNKMNEKGAG